MFAIVLEKVMFWWDKGGQNYTKCGIADGKGAECVQYLQDELVRIC